MPTAHNNIFRQLIIWGLLCTANVSQAGFTTVTDAQWDNTAVRKVLHTFAYGGFATDAQIQRWADMPPASAIVQILSFSPTNNTLSPPEDTQLQSVLYVDGADRTLEGLQGFWSSTTDPGNPTPAAFVAYFDPINASGDDFNPTSLSHTWLAATNKRGINPFRQKVGFWLSNYIMSAHLGAIGGNVHMYRTFYDDSMQLLSLGASFDRILAAGGSSATIAQQYGHKNNTYSASTGRFSGNDDFAREFHQLFFGITGEPVATDVDTTAYKNYYEAVTVENTAKALTGMQIAFLPVQAPRANFSSYQDSIDFTSDENMANHHAAGLEILNFLSAGTQNIFGSTALEKIRAIARVAINHPESELRLPMSIIGHFADDNLSARIAASPALRDEIHDAWISSGKNLVTFLRDYATSTQFHSPDRIKYQSAFDRNVAALNQNTVNNDESYRNYAVTLMLARMERQGAEVFRPSHFVFGGQTGIDAADNADIFKDAYNASICIADPGGACSDGWRTLGRTSNSTTGWTKNWGAIVSGTLSSQPAADALAFWLWNRFIGDGGKNYGPQERAHLTALLARGVDLPTYLAEQTGSTINEDGLSSEQLTDFNLPYANLIDANAATTLDFTDSLAVTRNNERIGLAVNFIVATPYMYVQEGL